MNINIKQTGDHKEEIIQYNFKTSKVQETLGNLSQNHDKKYSNCLPETPLKDLSLHVSECGHWDWAKVYVTVSGPGVIDFGSWLTKMRITATWSRTLLVISSFSIQVFQSHFWEMCVSFTSTSYFYSIYCGVIELNVSSASFLINHEWKQSHWCLGLSLLYLCQVTNPWFWGKSHKMPYSDSWSQEKKQEFIFHK